MEEKVYAVYGGHGSEYHRICSGNDIMLPKGVARPVCKEIAAILKDAKDVHLIYKIDETPIDFRKKIIKEKYHDLVKKFGVQGAKKALEEQNERIRQAGSEAVTEGS